MARVGGRPLLTAVAIAGVLAACGGGGGNDETLRGVLVLEGATEAYRTACVTSGRYDDEIHRGAEVVVRDGEEEVLATGRLREGEVVPAEEAFSITDCEFPFRVAVPSSDFYEIEVANSGGVTYSKDELEDSDWQVTLSLGR